MTKTKKLKIICDSACRIPDAHIKGRMNKGKSACGIVFLDEDDNIVHQKSFYLGEMTTPQAEYTGLIKALDSASQFCRNELEVWMDSEFIIRQMNGDYAIKSENMKPLFDKVKSLERRFSIISYFHHPRTTKLAKQADKLANDELDKRISL